MQVYKCVWVPKVLLPSQRVWAAAMGFEVVDFSVLDYTPIFEAHQMKHAMATHATWLFSSVKAVDFLQPLLKNWPNKSGVQVYTVGLKAAAALLELGFSIARTAPNAAELMPAIQNLSGPIAYFCNAQSTSFLNFGEIIKRLPVYDGLPTTLPVAAHLPDVVFGLSPNTLSALYAQRPDCERLPVVAIGPTTQKYLEARGATPLAVCSTPSVEACFEELLKRNADVFEK